MKYNMKFLLYFALFFQALMVQAQPNKGELSLNGEWRFSLDFDNTALSRGWQSDAYKYEGSWDKVRVPHSFSADGRYLFFEGTGWYRKTFDYKPEPGKIVILHFEAVYNRSQVWLNGHALGSHEGGYTPFEFDVTGYIREGKNVITVSANNRLDSLTIPTIGSNPANNGNVGWVNYGGITREVSLLVKPETYIENVKIDAIPDLAKGTSLVNIKALLVNKKNRDTVAGASIKLFKDDKPVAAKFKQIKVNIGSKNSAAAVTTISLDKKNTALWSVDHPALYKAEIVFGTDTQYVNFGIRKVEVKDAKLYVNGKSVKYGGGNLVLDYPRFGSVVNDSIADKYMRIMKDGGMEFQRLTHYPLPRQILDWADKNGMLIITEAGNWGYQQPELSNPELRKVYKKQLKEMIISNWNHPSVIAYSVGNEYDSHIPDGVDWTRDMFAFIQTIDSSRLKTLVSNKLNHDFGKAENEASYYADFVCANIYDNIAGIEKTINKIQNLYPAKPILISEWGKRADQVKTEEERAVYLEKAMEVFRKSSHVIGSSWWSVNDYYSRYAGSNADGQRPWGLVDYHLKPRGAYLRQQAELSPVLITKKSYTPETGKLIIEIRSRADFPSYVLQDYILKYNDQKMPLKTINPGESLQLTLVLNTKPEHLTIQIFKPTGFLAATTLIPLK
ncbi:MAG: sugar-binding domain-containing protein [Bacteroidota bacterium]